MEVTLQIPDDIPARLAAADGDLSRKALEAFALEELRTGRIAEPQLGEILGVRDIEEDAAGNPLQNGLNLSGGIRKAGGAFVVIGNRGDRGQTP